MNYGTFLFDGKFSRSHSTTILLSWVTLKTRITTDLKTLPDSIKGRYNILSSTNSAMPKTVLDDSFLI